MEKIVLFVDDEEHILKLFESLAQHLGYAPRSATNGDQALQIMQRDNVRVFFLDLRMPGMDGMELCRRIKQANPNTCVYAVSAYISKYSTDQFREAGFDGCFPKPFKIDLLMDACRMAFAKLERQGEQKP